MKNESLFSEFQEVSAKQWKQKIQFDLKGADYNETLVWESLEGIHVKPFYHSEDLDKTSSLVSTHNDIWQIGQSIYVNDEVKANEKAKDVLNKGVSSLVFKISNSSITWSVLFKNLDLTNTPIHLHLNFLDNESITRLINFVDDKVIEVYLHIDILGHLARTGNWFYNQAKDHQILEDIFHTCATKKNFSVLAVDLSLYQNAGGNMVQQLAYGLAHANEYLNHLSLLKQGSEEKSISMTFNVAVGGNYFFEIAKLKALRALWSALSQEYNYDLPCHIKVRPSKRNKTIYDYNVNMLRTTSECMSAVLGGANTVCNLPYDSLYHKDNEFGERIARNQLLLLKEESYFDDAVKAVEGTYYIESLTQQLAEKALVLFKQIENSGGFLKQLKEGIIQKKIKENAAKEQTKFDKGELVLIGTNTFQNLEDKMKDDLELHPFVKTEKRKTVIEPIIQKRLSEVLEQKRLQDE
ncbi:methylmalonyl-CoA mutase subunit beta [Croceitalea vernalis]|uniref:Methylmalonyl-CoA mutase subunit beta n=1 Tax=Croceitalea vernalis TaxID=3075599 RepID=A0ABU3BKL9_9FLAO|nr:methylmalonyl-CoA mutase subunit beta [Croceitalea sp. P007]MDT0622710.1 methylmalonyl-CoA mutase subunit beta [Croceitalea sp. P007]